MIGNEGGLLPDQPLTLGEFQVWRTRQPEASLAVLIHRDLGRLLVIWTEVLPPEQIHVVPVGQAGATAADLWLRFASVMSVEILGVFTKSGCVIRLPEM